MSDGNLHGDQPATWARTTATMDMKVLLLEGRRAERRPPRGQVRGPHQRWPKEARTRRKKTPGKTTARPSSGKRSRENCAMRQEQAANQQL